MNLGVEHWQTPEAEDGETPVVSPVKARIRGPNETEWGRELPVEVILDFIDPADFAALLLPAAA